ncbi:MAG: type II secretion system F family protein [Rhodospirillaceae bacterium]|jgi:tight adherence protein B|nr:type II secretion system F family protein [Rhodospirillaceae bacterium]MBT5244326.1 type II secretion system F family protein [Rhodospirillaceae bacterium]MBT5563687.1 type II secretion system F family protein [Rhodospirillaceae bacterium]MBT6241517.1 type II secretion system F family protein [Rhodospirillaceae bacterium]MBT7137067.1 type II secretion system F family protein [Rhodospirillaceae bacterium]
MNMTVVLIFFGVAISLGSLIFAVSGIASKPRKRMQGRIETIRLRAAGHVVTRNEENANTVKKQITSRFPLFEKLAKRFLPNQEMLAARLARTGREISIGAYIMVNIATALLVILLTILILGQSIALALLLGLIVGVGLPHMVIGQMATRRLKQFTEQFPDSIDLIVRGLKSGLPVTESIASVGQEMADPVGKEFRDISDRVKFGQPLDEALWETARRLDTAEFKFFVISISVQRETGGNLSEALGNLSDILRRRRQMGLKIKAMSSEAKASAIILGSLPFIMFGIIFALNPEYEMALFTDPRGQMMLGVGIAIMSFGVLVMNKMIKFEI